MALPGQLYYCQPFQGNCETYSSIIANSLANPGDLSGAKMRNCLQKSGVGNAYHSAENAHLDAQRTHKCYRSSEMRPITRTIRKKFIASQHRERESGYRSSEIRLIMRTIRQKFMIGNAKVATVRQKCIASQHRERESGNRSSEMRPIMRTVERKTALNPIS